MMIQATFSALLLLTVIKIAEGNKITIGKDAELQCKKWNKRCDAGNLCVIQHLQWPMNMSFPICIPESEISGMLIQVKLRICQKPPESGNCGARFVRWYFNTNIQRCSWFYYQGCRGNENNFKSKAICEAECLPNQQTNTIEKPLVYEPMVVNEPILSPGYSNYIERTYPVVISKEEREVRRKRRLEKKRQKRLRKLLRRKRRKSMRSKKRRREGKVKTRGKKKRKNKKNKHRKRGRRGKKKKNKKSKVEKSTITFIPDDEISEVNKKLMKKIVEKEAVSNKRGMKRKGGSKETSTVKQDQKKDS